MRGVKMSYFVKQTKTKKGIYLQIYEGFYDKEKKNSTHRSFRALGYLNDFIEQGIADPVSHFKAIADKMTNEERLIKQQEKIEEISQNSPEKNLGYFLLNAVNNQKNLERDLKFVQSGWGCNFNIFKLISNLIYARFINPQSKQKTLLEVFPKLFNSLKISLDQMYDGVFALGKNYQKIIDIYNENFKKIIKRDTSKTYFDCTNFYFEIDEQDDFRRKGPSKENKPNPLVGLGLLLDKNLIPLGMKIYPGNKSEKPIIREVISELKNSNSIKGKTIQVADKGLNCGENIVQCVLNGDGYIFSKSVKGIKGDELKDLLDLTKYEKILDENGDIKYLIREYIVEKTYSTSSGNGVVQTIKVNEKRVVSYNPKLAKKKQLEINKLRAKVEFLTSCSAKKDKYGEAGKYVNFIAVDKNGNEDGKIKTEINEKAIFRDLSVAGFNMLITSEVNANSQEIYSTYHNLWRIEESFKIMKSYLDARPVHVRKEESIKGHFLICYLSVFLLRILQFNVFQNEFSTEEIVDFIKNFRVVQIARNKFINIYTRNSVIEQIKEITKLPILNSYFSDLQIERILGYKPIFSTRI